MTLHVCSHIVQVPMALPAPERVETFVVRRAGVRDPLILLEAYDAEGLVAGGQVVVWELNQAIAALLSLTSQARRLALRDDGRGHDGHLDVVCDGGDDVRLVATSRRGTRRAVLETTRAAVLEDLNAVLHHYLTLTRSGRGRTIVLPDLPRARERHEPALPVGTDARTS